MYAYVYVYAPAHVHVPVYAKRTGHRCPPNISRLALGATDFPSFAVLASDVRALFHMYHHELPCTCIRASHWGHVATQNSALHEPALVT